MKKINGFSQKFHPYQTLSYTYFLCMVASYFVIIMPLSSYTSKIVGAILEILTALTVIISGYLVTVIDPSDPFMKRCREAQFNNTTYDVPIKDFYCTADKTYVMANSKHCKRCNRCTEGFDHHCKWVNNDVGKANYKHFIVMICSVTAFLMVYMGCAIALTVEFARDNLLLENDIYLYTNSKDSILGVMVIMWVLMAITTVFLLLVTNLLLFHFYLIYKGITTYQYIIAGENKKTNQENAKTPNAPVKKTFLDFILCLKKKKKVAQASFTLNENAQKNMAKEMNTDSMAGLKKRKESELSKKSETKNALDNTQNEDNFDFGAAQAGSENKERRLTSPSQSKSPQTITGQPVFTFNPADKDQPNQERVTRLAFGELENNRPNDLFVNDDFQNVKTALCTPHRDDSPVKSNENTARMSPQASIQKRELNNNGQHDDVYVEIEPPQKIMVSGDLITSNHNNYQQRMTPAFGDNKKLVNIRGSNHTLMNGELRLTNTLSQNTYESFKPEGNVERTNKYEV